MVASYGRLLMLDKAASGVTFGYFMHLYPHCIQSFLFQ